MTRAARPATRSHSPFAATLRLVRRCCRVALLVLVVCALAGCREPEPADVEATSREVAAWSGKPASASPRPVRDLDSTSVRNLSLLLAGVVPAAEREALDPVWRRHAEAMDALWADIAPQLQAMRSWALDTMPELATSPAPVFHPFAGPDPSSALALFPEASSYLMVSREAPGRLPMPESLSAEELEGDLERLRSIFRTLAGSGSFSRSEVEKALAGGAFDGVLPVVLALLVRNGALPLQIDYVAIDPETIQIHELPDDQHVASAMRILFADVGTEALLGDASLDERVAGARQRILYYFSYDLSNSGLFPHDPLHRLVAAQPMLHAYMKSSEYKPHLRGYSAFREMLLEQADAVLQDDSGLPLRSFTSDVWRVELYGRYDQPTAAFQTHFQEELAAAIGREQRPPLPFRFGYRSGDGAGCLILARRQQATAPTIL